MGRSSAALVIEPAYPAYVDANVIAGRKIVHLTSDKENGFLPEPSENVKADIIYICSPNNPTGAVFSANQLQSWQILPIKNSSIILFDAAYEAFIQDENIPHSIFELDRAETCAIEICSFSKTAGFTGTRLGYTVIPKALNRCDMNFNAMWVRNRTTKTNGVSYISVVLAIAVPPVPGAALTCYTILFMRLGIPTDAIAVVITLNVILEFVTTAVNIFCLQTELIELYG